MYPSVRSAAANSVLCQAVPGGANDREGPRGRRVEQLQSRAIDHREEPVPNVAILSAADLLAQARRAHRFVHHLEVADGPPHAKDIAGRRDVIEDLLQEGS